MNQLATQRLNKEGVSRIFKSELCTYSDPQRFYSYRRDSITGRMASFIWLE
jgi:copper oxidase (laccase) domain-containing protein